MTSRLRQCCSPLFRFKNPPPFNDLPCRDGSAIFSTVPLFAGKDSSTSAVHRSFSGMRGFDHHLRHCGHGEAIRAGPGRPRGRRAARNDDTGERPRHPPKRLSRGKPVGGVRPAAPRAVRHSDRSLSVRVRPVSPPIGQLMPSANTKVVASDKLPSRKR